MATEFESTVLTKLGNLEGKVEGISDRIDAHERDDKERHAAVLEELKALRTWKEETVKAEVVKMTKGKDRIWEVAKLIIAAVVGFLASLVQRRT